MRNRVKPKIHIQKILLLCLVAFFYFVSSCDLIDPPDIPCSVNITSPKNGTSFKEGENISFSSIVKHFTDHPDNKWEYLAKISMVKWVSDKDGEIIGPLIKRFGNCTSPRWLN